MGLLKALDQHLTEPIRRWITLAELQDTEEKLSLDADPVKVAMPWPDGVTRTCEAHIRYLDQDDWDATVKGYLDEKGNFKFEDVTARAAFFAAVCDEVRGFNRYTATKLGASFVKALNQLPETDIPMENGDIEALGKRLDLGVFLKVASECRNRIGYVQEHLEAKKNSSKPTSDSPLPASPPSPAPA